MKSNRLIGYLLSLILLTSLLPMTLFARNVYVPGEVLVRAKAGKEADFEKNAVKHGLTTKKVIKKIGYKLMKLPPRMTVEQAIEKLKDHPSIDYIGPNHTIHIAADPEQRLPNDPVFFYGDELLGIPQWGLYNDGSQGTVRADIHATEAWHITTGSPDVVIAILDTGVDYTHEDLEDKMLTGYNTIDGTTDTMDYNGHGTFTAGVAAASSDNWIGITGVSWGSPILPVKVIGDEGQGTEADGAEGIIWAADHGAKILNMSFATDINEPALEAAINYAWGKGCLPVAATGNENVSFNMYPAAYPKVVAVGASNEFNERCTRDDWGSGGSNFGSYIDVVAPGNWITSTWSDPMFGQTYFPNSGTSAAAPFVAGEAALIWSIHPDWTNQQVFDQIIRTSDDTDALGWDQYTGWGRINAYRALTETVTSIVPSIGMLRQIQNGKYVVLNDKVITAGTGQIPNRAYVEEPLRSGGIMVYYTTGVPFGFIPGDRVDVSGTLSMVNGERALVGATMTKLSSGIPLRPLGIINRYCTSPTLEMLRGMLVSVWGRVTYVGWDYMYVDDGSALWDGSGTLGIRIQAPNTTLPAEGKTVMVTGELGLDIPQGAPNPVSVVRPRNPADIKAYN